MGPNDMNTKKKQLIALRQDGSPAQHKGAYG